MSTITSSEGHIEGDFKQKAADFEVQEIPLYEPNGTGQHLYISLTRENWTTPSLQKELASVVDIPKRDIGYAGKKDKKAVATQRFSMDLPSEDPDEVAQRIESALPVEVNWAKRHRNKLKLGHHLGNRFNILIRGAGSEALEKAEKIKNELDDKGLPNYYGAQRFGRDGENADRGKAILDGDFRAESGWKKRLFLNAFQSELFNQYLDERIDRDWFQTLKTGDIAKKRDTGGLFEVKHIEDERPRFERDDITYTGPIHGSDIWWAEGEPGKLEKKILEASKFDIGDLAKEGLSGSRRRARVVVDDLEIESEDEGLRFKFSLPKGSYATVLMQEFLQ